MNATNNTTNDDAAHTGGIAVSANQRARQYRKARDGRVAVEAIDMANRTAVIYVRISKNRDNETSTESQELVCREWCQRNGIHVAAVFVDAGESAFAGKAPRPQFRKALDMIKSRAANTLVVYKLDRFMRDATSAVNVRDEIHSWAGSVVSATEGVDTADRTNGTASLIFGILAWLAEMESVTKSDRMKDWHNGRYTHDAGALPPGGPRPFGYTRIRKELDDGTTVPSMVIVEDEARLIHTAARMVLDDGTGLKGIATALGALSRTGWKHVLTSETTAGLRYDGTTHHDGNWTGILDRDTWEALARTLNDPNRLTAGPRGERRHLLSGLFTCGKHEGVPMRMRTHDAGPRYQCTQRGCYNGISAAQADAAVRDFIFATLDRDAWKAMRNAGRGYDPSVIADYENRLRKITALYAAGEMSDDEYETGRGVIRDAMRKAQESEFLALPDVDDVQRDWDTLPLDGKRLVINAWIASMHVDPYVQGEAPDSRIHIRRHKDGGK